MILRRSTTPVLLFVLCALCAACSAPAVAVPERHNQEVMRIWPSTPPGAGVSSAHEVVEGPGTLDEKITNVTVPTLTVVRPAPGHATGAAMIVLPGGGFNSLEWQREGVLVANWLANRGVTAFVLKYRVTDLDLATEVKMAALLLIHGPNTFRDLMTMVQAGREMALEDGMQAVRIVRSKAREFGISANRIGMIGFSAGAITTASIAIDGNAETRLDFAAIIYGSALGDKAPPKDAPPLFIVHCENDPIIPVKESLKLFQAWQNVGRPAELHIYPTGLHGFGMRPVPGTAAVAWPQAFDAWLRWLGVVSDQPGPAR